MIKKYKNLLIILAVAVGVVVTAVIFCFTLFTVKDIKIDFRTETAISYSDEEIVEKSGIKTGKCVFFLKKNQFEANIEKNFPYLEVINIETIIPSHIVIHVAERQEFYAIMHNDKIIYCDDEFKILKVENGTNYDSTASNAILIPSGQLNITNEKIEAGEFLEFKQNGLKDLYNSMLVNSRTRADMLSMFKEISVAEYVEKEVVKDGKTIEKQWQTTIKITTHNGRGIYLHNIDYGLKYKVQKTFAILSNIMEIQTFVYDGKTYDRKAQDDQSEIDNILSLAEIHVENYQSEYQYDEASDKIYKAYSEKDCYYSLVYNGKTLEQAN